MKKMTLEDLKEALENSWSRETSSKRNKWDPNNPAKDHCCVTALVVQDYFGGDLKAVRRSDGSAHWWNRLPNGSEIDLTKSQFSEKEPRLIAGLSAETVERGRALFNRWTFKRYKILKEKVEEFLKNEGEKK